MIAGVKIKNLKIHEDVPDREEDRGRLGFLTEVLTNDDGLMEKFGQINFTVANSGTIKAFHLHEKQDDLWFISSGRAVIVLHDLRESSPTKGETQIIYAGPGDGQSGKEVESEYKLILIPIGVAHGYKVISRAPAALFYVVTERYNRECLDEIRIPYNDERIKVDWEKL